MRSKLQSGTSPFASDRPVPKIQRRLLYLVLVPLDVAPTKPKSPAFTRSRESDASDVVNRTGCIVPAIPLNASPTSELSPNIPSSWPTRSWLLASSLAANLRTS